MSSKSESAKVWVKKSSISVFNSFCKELRNSLGSSLESFKTEKFAMSMAKRVSKYLLSVKAVSLSKATRKAKPVSKNVVLSLKRNLDKFVCTSDDTKSSLRGIKNKMGKYYQKYRAEKRRARNRRTKRRRNGSDISYLRRQMRRHCKKNNNSLVLDGLSNEFLKRNFNKLSSINYNKRFPKVVNEKFTYFAVMKRAKERVLKLSAAIAEVELKDNLVSVGKKSVTEVSCRSSDSSGAFANSSNLSSSAVLTLSKSKRRRLRAKKGRQ